MRILCVLLLALALGAVSAPTWGQSTEIRPPSLTEAQFAAARADYAELLGRIVRPEGRCDYRAYGDPNDARLVIEGYLATLPASAPTGEAEMTAAVAADVINAHNAAMLWLTLTAYPRERWDDEDAADRAARTRFAVLGGRFSVGELAAWAKRYPNWRIGAALYEPTRTGPALAATLYEGEQLDEQLTQALQRYLCSCAGIRVDHEERRVLVGERLWEIRGELIDIHKQRLGQRQAVSRPVTLIEALMPCSCPGTRRLLAGALNYQAAPLPKDARLDDIDRRQWYDPREIIPPVEDTFPCGRP